MTQRSIEEKESGLHRGTAGAGKELRQMLFQRSQNEISNINISKIKISG